MSVLSENLSGDPVGPVVSAAHLASGKMPALSELEYALTVSVNAFHRWMTRASAAAGLAGLTPTDILVLHSVHHRGREKTLSDLCLVLNIEDTHLVNYALKKLESLEYEKEQSPFSSQSPLLIVSTRKVIMHVSLFFFSWCFK